MMSVKDHAASVLDALTEEQLIDFVQTFADDSTVARLESDLAAAGTPRKRYSNFSEIIAELDAEDDDE